MFEHHNKSHLSHRRLSHPRLDEQTNKFIFNNDKDSLPATAFKNLNGNELDFKIRNKTNKNYYGNNIDGENRKCRSIGTNKKDNLIKNKSQALFSELISDPNRRNQSTEKVNNEIQAGHKHKWKDPSENNLYFKRNINNYNNNNQNNNNNNNTNTNDINKNTNNYCKTDWKNENNNTIQLGWKDNGGEIVNNANNNDDIEAKRNNKNKNNCSDGTYVGEESENALEVLRLHMHKSFLNQH